MNNCALITGASGGIGLDLAKLFAEDNINLILVARSKDKLEAIAKEFEVKNNINVLILQRDLSCPDSPQEIYDELRNKNIKVEYLVNNAGFGSYNDFTDTDWDVYSRMIQLNITSLANLTHLFVKEMLKNRSGRIMNVASTAGFQPIPGLNVYSATKAFVLSFTEALNNELRGTGITATALCPGFTLTGFQKTAGLKGSGAKIKFLAMKSETVARTGYQGMMEGKSTIITGIINKISAFSVRLAPRKIVPYISKSIIRKK